MKLKIPIKMQKVQNDPLLDNAIFKRRALFLIKDDFFEDVYGDLVEQYAVTLSRMLNDILTLDQQ